ncbi:MAG: hypothetical protein IKN59_02800 [Paludibacteraceae bacterium]|nr:hypothetical protein [Paludibacteraceae bacterium]
MRTYISAELHVVKICHNDVIATSYRMETNDTGLRMYNESYSSGSSYELLGYGED